MHLVNSKFLGWLYRTLPACQSFFYAIQRSLSFEMGERQHCEASFTSQSILLHDVYMCYGLLRIRIFLLCIQLSTPFCRPVMRTWERGLTDKLQMQWSQHTDAIRDNLSQDTLLLKGTNHELSTHANAQGIWFPLMPVLHFSSVSAQRKDWNVTPSHE